MEEISLFFSIASQCKSDVATYIAHLHLRLFPTILPKHTGHLTVHLWGLYILLSCVLTLGKLVGRLPVENSFMSMLDTNFYMVGSTQ